MSLKRALPFLAVLILGQAPNAEAQLLSPMHISKSSSKPESVDSTKKQSGQVVFSAFADGNLRDLANGNEGDAAAAGSFGVRLRNVALRHGYLHLSAKVGLASTVDTLRRNAGLVLLVPSAGKGLRSGVVEANWEMPSGSGATRGLYGYFATTAGTWGNDSIALPATIAGQGLGYFWGRRAEDTQNKNAIGVQLQLGLAAREIWGDIGGDDPLRQLLIGTDRKTFTGVEGGVAITINGVTAALHVYGFAGPDAGIDGFTGGQIGTGISVDTPLFTISQ